MKCYICSVEFKETQRTEKYCSMKCAYEAIKLRQKNKMVKPMFRIYTGIGGCVSNNNGQKWVYVSVFVGYKRYYFVPFKWNIGNGKCELTKNLNHDTTN